MPPEATSQTPATPPTPPPTPTPTPPAPNSAEARTPSGELKTGLSAPQTETSGETKSTPPSPQLSESEKKLAGETKLEGEKKEGEGEKKPAEGVPEKYEFKGLPEGLTVPDDATALFKDLGLDNDKAQKLVDYQVKKSQEAARQPFETWQKMNREWLDNIQKDAEYKGDMKKVVTDISKVIDGLTVNDPQLNKEFREGMDLTGAGNHPAFVKFMYRLSQQLNEGGYVKPGGPSPLGQRAPGSGERPTPAKALFPNLA